MMSMTFGKKMGTNRQGQLHSLLYKTHLAATAVIYMLLSPNDTFMRSDIYLKVSRPVDSVLFIYFLYFHRVCQPKINKFSINNQYNSSETENVQQTRTKIMISFFLFFTKRIGTYKINCRY